MAFLSAGLARSSQSESARFVGAVRGILLLVHPGVFLVLSLSNLEDMVPFVICISSASLASQSLILVKARLPAAFAFIADMKRMTDTILAMQRYTVMLGKASRRGNSIKEGHFGGQTKDMSG